MLLHAAIHWPEVDLQLQPFQHAVSPLEYILQSRVQDYADLQCLLVWGYSTFVLHPYLQYGKKLPNSSPCSLLGSFIGYSQVHCSSVSLVLNIQTGEVTPQYQSVHYDWFSAVLYIKTTSLCLHCGSSFFQLAML